MKTLSGLVLGAALIFPAAVLAEVSPIPIEKLISEMADKPDQHHAIAQYYKEKADEVKKELATHIKMCKGYNVGYGKAFNARGMRNRCDKLKSNDESTIKEYEAMAAEHEAIAVKKP